MNFGDRIIKLRKDNKISQEELAESLGVTRQTISNWENYKNYPDIAMLSTISDKYNISFDELLKKDVNLMKKYDKTMKLGKINRFIIPIIILLILIGLITSYFAYKHHIYSYSLINNAIIETTHGELIYNGKTYTFTMNGEKDEKAEYINYEGMYIKNIFKDYTKDNNCGLKWVNAPCELTYILNDPGEDYEEDKMPDNYRYIDISTNTYDGYDLNNSLDKKMFKSFPNEKPNLTSFYNFYMDYKLDKLTLLTPLFKYKEEQWVFDHFAAIDCMQEEFKNDAFKCIYDVGIIGGKYFGLISYTGEECYHIYIQHNDKNYEIILENCTPEEIQDILNSIYFE